MNFPNQSKSAKPIFLASIIVLSALTVGFLIPSAYAEHPPGFDSVTKSVDAGFDAFGDIYSIRDINSPLDQVDENGDLIIPTSIESCGKNKGCLIITVTDVNANLDVEGIDKVLATVTSSDSSNDVEIELEETDVDTGVFVGTVAIHKQKSDVDLLQVKPNSKLEVIYDPEKRGVGRADFLIGLNFGNLPDGTETVVMKDEILLDASSCTNDGYDLITYPINYQAPAVIGQNVFVTISITNAFHENWENADPTDDLDTNFVKVLYKKPGGTWEDLTNGDTSEHNIVPGLHPTGTIKNVDQPSTAVSSGGTGDVSGQYALGYTLGCVGGGGGGLVRPGFVVNALAGASVVSGLFGSGGGSGGGSAPTVTSGSVSSTDKNIGFEQQGLTLDTDSKKESSFEQTQIVNTGDPLTFNFDIIEDGGAGKIEHATMYFFMDNKVDLNKRYDVTKGDASIMFDQRKSVYVNDPNGYFENTGFEILQKDTYEFVLKYDVSFAKEIDTASIVLRTWDTTKHSSDKIFHDALIVEAATEQKQLPEDSISSFLDTLDEKELTTEEPAITKTGFPGIPLWVKNNAMWWHEKQIDDADFVAGIQYMINEEIITIPETEITSSTTDSIPPWISNVAGYWSNDEISDDEFVQAMQWLVSNGVMEVV